MMPIVKPIAGHTTTKWIQRYLEKNGRALARDFYNLSWDENEMEGYDASLKADVMWSEEMDALRAAYGNDRPHGGMRARTFKHFIVSPDPSDDLDLARLRELTRAWVCKHFSEYQAAIVYHDDNAGRIPHAHVVVNNTNVVTGKRLQTTDPLALNRSLQDMAQSRQLSYLCDDAPPEDGFSKLAAKDGRGKPHARSRQEVYMSRSERGVVESGAYSWVSDIRDRVGVAKALARNESEFRRILDLMEVDVADNSPKARREDWIFTLRDQGSKHVSGERLGTSFGKAALLARFSRSGTSRPDAAASRRFLSCAKSAVEINDLVELHRLAATLETAVGYGIASIDDYDRRIASLARKLDATDDVRRRTSIERSMDALRESRTFAADKGLLPPNRPATPAKHPKAARRTSATGQGARHTSASNVKQTRQQQRDGRERGSRER